MHIDTEGIVLKQIKIVNDYRMLHLFTKKYGKINVSAKNFSKGKSRSSLALSPFTFGRYELYKGKDFYGIDSAEPVRSYYRIGEDIDRYMSCSYILEFTDRILIENQPSPQIFELLTDFLDIIENRKKKYLFLVRAYEIKALQYTGLKPHVEDCVLCGASDEEYVFSIKDGGIVCRSCIHEGPLIYQADSGIIKIIRYILNNPLKSFEKLALDEKAMEQLSSVVKSYIKYHLDIGVLKSEEFI